MRGLLWKELAVLKRYARTILLLGVFYLVLAYFNQDTIAMTGFLGGMSIMLCVILCYASLAYDEQAKWDKYVCTMPLSRAKIVGSKYVLALIAVGVGLLLSGLLCVVLSALREQLDFLALVQILGSLAVAALILLAILLPVAIRFGVEKSRFIILGIVLIPVLLGLVVQQMGLTLSAGAVSMLQGLLWAMPVIAVVLYLLSFALSLRIYRRKEF